MLGNIIATAEQALPFPKLSKFTKTRKYIFNVTDYDLFDFNQLLTLGVNKSIHYT